MSEIYKILPKHFYAETSEKEEKLIQEYKRNNSIEYNLYKEFRFVNNMPRSLFEYFVKMVANL